MSKLKEFRAIEHALERQLLLLESLKKNTTLMQELEFEKKIKALMKRHNKTLEDIISLLEHSAPSGNGIIHEDSALNASKTERPKKKAEANQQQTAPHE